VNAVRRLNSDEMVQI